MTWFAVAAAAVAAVGAAYTGYSQSQNSKYQAEQANADAEAELAKGRLEAERIRKEKNKVQSAARAAAAENGLNVNEGTAVVINDKIELDANYDANMAATTGYNTSQRLKSEANVYKKNAQSALIGGAIGAANTGAQTYGSTKGWK